MVYQPNQSTKKITVRMHVPIEFKQSLLKLKQDQPNKTYIGLMRDDIPKIIDNSITKGEIKKDETRKKVNSFWSKL